MDTENRSSIKESCADIKNIVTQDIINNVDSVMEKRGYTLLNTTDGKLRYYVSERGISAEVFVHSPKYITVQLKFHHDFFTISSGYFDLNHPQFRKRYESTILKIQRKLGEII